MRQLTDHIVPGGTANQLTVAAMDEPGQGGACHRYEISDRRGCVGTIIFQNGPIKERGVNGITQEALLAIVIDRLRSFQAGPFACDANARALISCGAGLMALQERTGDRIKRGVEGLNQK